MPLVLWYFAELDPIVPQGGLTHVACTDGSFGNLWQDNDEIHCCTVAGDLFMA